MLPMESPDVPPEIQRRCRENGIQLSDAQYGQIALFVRSVLDWNGKINLISRRDQENIWFSHILHSLSILFYVDVPGGSRILDLGTGGGFPGIPLAIARPDVRMVLIDSIRKKTMAVQEMIERIGLTGVSVWTGRAEEMSLKPGTAGSFDYVFTRAVASLEDLARWSRPYLKKRAAADSAASGKIVPPALVALKGGDLEREISSARRKGRLKEVRVTPMSFPGSTSLPLEDKKLVAVYF